MIKMSRTDEINKIAKEHVVEDIIQNIAKSNDDNLTDLAQDIYIQLLEMPNDKFKILQCGNQLKYYLVGLIRNNVFSTTSPYYYKYKRFKHEEIDENISIIY